MGDNINCTHKQIEDTPISLIFQANCIDSTAEAEVVFAGEVKKMQAEKMKPQEQVTLEPYERDHAVVVGIYRPPPKKKAME